MKKEKLGSTQQEKNEKSDIRDHKKVVKGLKSKEVGKQLRAVRSACTLLREEAHAAGLVAAGALEPLLNALHRKDWFKKQGGGEAAPGGPLRLHATPRGGSRCRPGGGRSPGASTERAPQEGLSKFIPNLLALLADEGDLSQRAILCLGSLALQAEARRAARAHGAVAAILQRMHTRTPHKLLRTYVKTFTNLCSHDEINFELFSPALPYLYQLLTIEDEDVVDLKEHGLSIQPQPVVVAIDNTTSLTSGQQQNKHKAHAASDVVEAACTALGNILHGGKECVEAVQCSPGVTQQLVALLSHERDNVKGAALTAVGNMLAGTDEQVQRCLDAGCVEPLVSLLQHTQASLVQEAARATANILAGTHSHIQHALDKHILSPLRDILTHGDPECRQQAAYAVSCLCVRGSMDQLEQVSSRGVLEPYVSWFAATSVTLAGKLVDGLHALIEAAERDGDLKLLCYKMDENDVLDQLLHLKDSVADEEQLCKICKLKATLRKYARMERFIVHDNEQFTAAKIVGELHSQQQTRRTRATRALYCMLSEQHPPIHALLEAGIMPPLVTALHSDDCSVLQNVAAWSLSKITAGTYKHKMAVIESGAVPVLVSLLPRGNTVSELAACALGDMTLGHREIRDAVMDYMHSTTEPELRDFIINYKRTCKECREKSMEDMEPVLRALPLVSELMVIGDQFMQWYACYAIASIMVSAERVKATQAVPGLTERVVTLLHHEETPVREAALIAVTNMLDGTDAQADRCIAAGCIEPIVSCLQSSEPSLVELSIWAAGNLLQHPRAIQPALKQDILPPLVNVIASNTDTANKLPVAFAIIILWETCSSMEFSSALKRAQLVCYNMMEQYFTLLLIPEPTLVKWALDGLYMLLNTYDDDLGYNVKDLCSRLEKIGVIKQLQALQEQSIEEEVRVKANQVSVQIRSEARGEPFTVVDEKVYTVTDIVQDLKSEEVTKQMSAARAASSLLSPCCEEETPKTVVIEAGLIPPLVAALDRNDNPELQEISAITLANIAGGTHAHNLAVVNSGALPKLVFLMSHGNELSVIAAATALGKVSINTPGTRDLVLSLGAVPALMLHMQPDAPVKMLRSCIYAYAILCQHHVSRSTMEPVLPALPVVSELLGVEDNIVLQSACVALRNITFQDAGDIIETVTAVPGLLERLMTLLRHEDTQVQCKALSVVTNLVGGTDTQADRCLQAGCLEPVVELLWSPELLVQEQAARAISNLLQYDDSKRLFLEKDIHTPLLNMLDHAEPNSFLQSNAAGALTALVGRGTPEQIKAFIQGGGIPKLVAVVACEVEVARTAIIALGAMAETYPMTIDVMLRNNIVGALTTHLTLVTPRKVLKHCICVYKYLCRYVIELNEPAEMLEILILALPHISTMLFIEDEHIIECASLALFVLMMTDAGMEAVQATSGLTARLVALISHKATAVKKAAVAAVTLILSKSDTQLDAECVEQMLSHLQCRDPALMEEAAMLTRAELGDSHPQLQRALHEDALTPLMRLASFFPRDLPKAITNLCRLATPTQRARLVSSGVLEPYCALLTQADLARAGDALHSLHALLQIAEDNDMLEPLCLKLEEIGVLEQLKLLRDLKEKEISKKARSLLQTYFSKKKKDEKCVLA